MRDIITAALSTQAVEIYGFYSRTST